MKEYIEREAALKAVLGLTIVDPAVAQYANAVCLILRDMPVADVAPVKHGRWVSEVKYSYIPPEFDKNGELISHEYLVYRCSLCGRETMEREPYCHCGALMDGKEDDHNGL